MSRLSAGVPPASGVRWLASRARSGVCRGVHGMCVWERGGVSIGPGSLSGIRETACPANYCARVRGVGGVRGGGTTMALGVVWWRLLVGYAIMRYGSWACSPGQ